MFLFSMIAGLIGCPSDLGRVETYACVGIWVRSFGEKRLGYFGAGLGTGMDRCER